MPTDPTSDRGRARKPVDHVVSGDWPHADLDGDPAAAAAQALARNLARARADRSLSLRAVGELTGVDFTVVSDVENGRHWVDIKTLARLEQGLLERLWPGPPLPPEPDRDPEEG